MPAPGEPRTDTAGCAQDERQQGGVCLHRQARGAEGEGWEQGGVGEWTEKCDDCEEVTGSYEREDCLPGGVRLSFPRPSLS